jgi:hypothetical protein
MVFSQLSKLARTREFGKWVSRNFPNLRNTVSKDDQAAIIWAAEFPKNRQEISAKNSRSGV